MEEPLCRTLHAPCRLSGTSGPLGNDHLKDAEGLDGNLERHHERKDWPVRQGVLGIRLCLSSKENRQKQEKESTAPCWASMAVLVDILDVTIVLYVNFLVRLTAQ